MCLELRDHQSYNILLLHAFVYQVRRIIYYEQPVSTITTHHMSILYL